MRGRSWIYQRSKRQLSLCFTVEFSRAGLSDAGRLAADALEQTALIYLQCNQAIERRGRRYAGRHFGVHRDELGQEIADRITDIADNKFHFNMLLQYPPFFKAHLIRVERAFSNVATYRKNKELVDQFRRRLNYPQVLQPEPKLVHSRALRENFAVISSSAP
ncbi:MAG: hypothetical protein GF418_03270 [Chitinivibrionales bacterium]|nr:hypothetical protein [Chitinivibrionales bacterium]MBD3394623.1 hypothetical protein [Chitinivibrionales bacterium]